MYFDRSNQDSQYNNHHLISQKSIKSTLIFSFMYTNKATQFNTISRSASTILLIITFLELSIAPSSSLPKYNNLHDHCSYPAAAAVVL